MTSWSSGASSQLVQDTTDCATGGECAVVDVLSNNTFEGSTLVTVTVLEKTPDAVNDCDRDGTPDGTNDCDGDGTPDLVVLVDFQHRVPR